MEAHRFKPKRMVSCEESARTFAWTCLYVLEEFNESGKKDKTKLLTAIGTVHIPSHHHQEQEQLRALLQTPSPSPLLSSLPPVLVDSCACQNTFGLDKDQRLAYKSDVNSIQVKPQAFTKERKIIIHLTHTKFAQSVSTPS